jgi:integrase/recombinase XerD
MKPTDFSKHLTDFFTKYLTHERGLSSNTVVSYRDTFVLLITFIEREKRIKPEKLELISITKKLIVEFLDWLQSQRGSSIATRNQRLGAIHSFFKYVQYQRPDALYEYQQIMSIQIKKVNKPLMSYLTIDGIRLLLKQPDVSTKKGRRDLALLSLLYDTGARVQEVIDLTPAVIRFNKPATILLKGKGDKSRVVPLLDDQVNILKQYMAERKLLEPFANQYPLFANSYHQKLTRAGVTNILLKYVKKARQETPDLIPEKISCHSLRHSKAMHLLQAGINLVYIRDILGHVSVQTTETYARADANLKREALEKAYVNVKPAEAPDAIWIGNSELKTWLNSF